MDTIEIFQVDAFTDKIFHGNPAAVCLLNGWLNDELMQAIAFENNLSETAFIIKTELGYAIRWFTPKGEISLCGHATLAAAFVLFELGKVEEDKVIFSSLGGELLVEKRNDRYCLNFPRLTSKKTEKSDLMNLIDQPIVEAYESDLDIILLLATEDGVAKTQVDLRTLSLLPARGLIITARSQEYDFYSRCFYPRHNIPEDPVTGSAHCVLAPYWAEKLEKTNLHALQGSYRKGELFCEVFADKVLISGYCTWYSQGQLVL